jgi:hypothetical protein
MKKTQNAVYGSYYDNTTPITSGINTLQMLGSKPVQKGTQAPETGVRAMILYINSQKPLSVQKFIEANELYAKSGSDTVENVLDIMEAKGDKAIQEVMEMHPDKESFEDAFGGGNCMICKGKSLKNPYLKLVLGLLLLAGAFFLIYKYVE